MNESSSWLTPQVIIPVVLFLIALITFLWKVPSKNDIKEIREDLRQVRQDFTNHLNLHISSLSAKQGNSNPQEGPYSISEDTHAPSDPPSDN